MPTVQIAIDGVTVAAAVQGATRLSYGWVGIGLGAHSVTATAVDIGGASAAATKTINAVVDPQDVPFRTLLDSFKSNLASGNKAAAMTLMSSSAQQLYGPVFDALLADMPQIVSEWSQAAADFTGWLQRGIRSDANDR